MKKMMVAIAVICSAVALNAAQFSWGFSSDAITTELGGENWIEGGTALLYLGTVSYDSVKGWDTTGATLLATGGQNADYNYGALTAGPTSPSHSAVLADGGQAYTLILVQQDDVADIAGFEGMFYLENGTSKPGSYMAGTDNVKVATFLSATEVGGGMWQSAAAVPEPTSGLLLLLGMAGLALSRKQA